MKRILRSLMLMAAMLLPFASNAQNTLTVADGTTTSSYVPVYGMWADAYLRCQTIYPAGEISAAAGSYGMTGGTISSITYYISSPASEAWTGTFEVKVMEVTDDTLSAFVDMTNATTVYTGTLDGTQSTMTVTFSTPYTYLGGNLLVEVSQTATGNWKSCSFYGIASSGSSWQGYSSTTWASITGSAANFIPKTTFTFTGGTQITCPPVENLSASDITSDGATLTWGGNASSYIVYEYANVDSTSYTVYDTATYLSSLDANTIYTYGIVANCGNDGVSAMRTVTFRTACAVEGFPFSETFDESLYSDPCWRGASGQTAAQIFDGDTLNLGAATSWTYNNAEYNGLAAGHYSANIYGTGCKRWMVTPPIDLAGVTSAQLSFDVAFTKYSGASAAEGFENNNSQAFMVIISTDGGNTWDSTNAVTWQNVGGDHTLASIASTSYINQIVNLNQYIGDTIKIAFYAQSTVSGGDNNIHIDNILVDAVPNCPAVTGLSVSNITTTTATVSWNEAGYMNSYFVEGDSVWETGYVTFQNNSITFTTLQPATMYTIGITTICDDGEESSMVTVTFNTACASLDLPYIETFGANSATRSCWTLEAYGNIGGANGMGFVTVADREVLRFSSYSNASDYNQYGYSPILNVSSEATGLQVEVTYATYSDNDKLWFGYITANDTIWDTTAFSTEGSTDFQTETYILPTNAIQLVTHYYGNYSYYAWIDEVSITELTDSDSNKVMISANSSIPVHGSVTPAGVSHYFEGDTVTFTATPDSGYLFDHWVVSCFDTVGGDVTLVVVDTVYVNPFDIIVDSNILNHTLILLQAYFESVSGEQDSMTVYVATADATMGTTNPAPGVYHIALGDSITINPLSNTGYHFFYWITESLYSNGNIYTDTIYESNISYTAMLWTMTTIRTATAYFEADPFVPVESTISADEITYWVGTGSNEAIIAVNWVGAAYAWGVRYNGSITVQSAMDTIAAYDSRFNYTLGDWGLSDITFDEGNFHLAGDPMSWWESKNNGVGGDMGLYQTLANGDLEKWAQPVAGVWTDSVWDEQWQYWMQIYTYTDEILPMWAPAPEEVTITFTVNDATMGTITPSGLITFEVGEAFTVTATPAANCHFVNWVVTTAEGETIVMQRDMLSFTDTIEANWDGSTLTANFARNQGIEEVDGFDFQAYSVDGKIVVKGVENKDVNIYDVTGRNMKSVAKATETIEYIAPSTGVYLVKVGDSAVKRVVVLR